jgi:hypothetical protein
MRMLRPRRLAAALALAALGALALAGCGGLHGSASGRVTPQKERQGGAYDAGYQGSGSFAYAGVGEYDGEQTRNSDPHNILNAGYDHAY